MRTIILVLNLCFISLLFSQEKGLKIYNETLKKEIIIKENKRIKVKTLDGEKISGRFKIVDPETIMIKNKKIAFSNLEKIKRHPLALSVITKLFFYYYGTALAGASIVVYAISGDATSYLLTIPAALLIYGGSKPINILKGYKKTRNWNYEAVTIFK